MLRILLLEDSLFDTELIQVCLANGGLDCELVQVETSTDFQRALATHSFDLILSDYSLPAFDGITALELAQVTCPNVPFIFVSATLGEELAIETLKSGATDYVLKQRLERLVPAVKRALREMEERVERKRAQTALRQLAEELEQRVEERTIELAQANQSLRGEIAERKRVEASLRRSESTLRSYFELPLIGIGIYLPDKTWIEVNDKLCDIFGYERDELMQSTWVDITYPNDLEAEFKQFNQILIGACEGYSIDKRFVCKNGEVIWASLSTRCIYRADGAIDYFVALVQDITERKRAEEQREQLIREQAARLEAEVQGVQAAFLAQASTVLSSSLDYETTLKNMATLAVPFLADWCAVDILEDNQSIRRVAIAHLDPKKEELAWELNRRYPENFNATEGLPRILRTGQSEMATAISDSDLAAVAQDAEHLQILRELGLKSCIVVPLMARGRILGAITLVTAESERRYTPEKLPLVEDLARRAAMAVDNARLYRASEAARRATQEARQIAEQIAERTANLQALTAALSEMLSLTQVGEVVVNRALIALNANAGVVALLVDFDQTLEVISAFGESQEILAAQNRIPITAKVPIAEAVRTKTPILIESREAGAQRYPYLATGYINTKINAWIALPLIVDGCTVGGISFSFVNARRFSEEDCAFMQSMAQQCAQAIQRARAYAAQQQAQAEAQAANRMKDEFLATLSHELRTPLNAMLGWTQLLRTRKFDEIKMAKALETIDRNTKSLAALIEDILDISRIITGKLKLSVAPCELVSVMEAAIETVRPAAEAKMIQIECIFDRSAEPVLGDANRLQQVVWNLLSNAIKFTPQGGRVVVRLERLAQNKGLNQPINLSFGENSDKPPTQSEPFHAFAQIQITDTGKGIAPDFLPFVFERFRQENSSSTRSYGGLGLGLAIVRYLVEQHGGTVQVFSQGDGLGATFTVQLPILSASSKCNPVSSVQTTRSRVDQSNKLLPLTPSSAQFSANIVQSNSEPPNPSSVLNGLRVLIVDDETDARDLIVTILEHSGAQVSAVSSASEALNVLQQSQADVLVSDIGMPDVDGYTLMRQIRKLQPEQGGDIPAVALTAYARDSDRIAAIEAGFQAHLPKPFDPSELVERVAKLAECRSASSSAK